MSHIVTIKTEVRDPTAVSAACQRLHLPEPIAGSTRLFSGVVSGLAVQFPEWRYPVVCQTDTGQVLFDNFEGRWGDRVHLDRFFQMYAVEKTHLEARRQGFEVYEQPLSDGSIKLSICVGGAA
ncbi:MAG: DUF1257 domain-containing protein [Planctomycetales bacterium]|nr:DUF1257 domain-containing protein [Planctomycetales bacterium]